jgi:hypothetical protein
MKKIATLMMIVLLAACASDAKPVAKPEPVAGPKINLDVQRINFMDRSGYQPADSPYSSNNFRPTISESIRKWASERLQAVGNAGEADIIVKDASLTSQTLPHEDSMFKRAQASKYTARAEIEIDIRGRTGYGLASAKASRYETLPEDPTAIEKQNAYYTVLTGLMHDLTANFETSLHDHANDYIVTAPILPGTSAQPTPPPTP